MAVILIVEDDFLICEMAKLMIEDMNHHALVASDFEQAMELTVSDNGIGMKDQVSAKIPERRGSDYVTIFVRQLGGIIVPPILEESGTTVRVRLPMLVVTPEGVEQSGPMI